MSSNNETRMLQGKKPEQEPDLSNQYRKIGIKAVAAAAHNKATDNKATDNKATDNKTTDNKVTSDKGSRATSGDQDRKKSGKEGASR